MKFTKQIIKTDTVSYSLIASSGQPMELYNHYHMVFIYFTQYKTREMRISFSIIQSIRREEYCSLR